jgi:magnesium/cobalt transport protein CorA
MSIQALLSSADGHDATVDLHEWSAHRLDGDQLLWIDLEDPSDAELDEVVESLRLEVRSAEALRAGNDRRGATVHDEAVEVVIHCLPDDLDERQVPLEIMLGDGWIVTRHERAIPFVTEHRARIQDERETGRLRPIEWLIAFLDAWIDTFFVAAEQLEREVDELDDAALGSERDLLGRLVRMRRRIAHVRRILSPHREVAAELARADFLPERHREGAEGLEAVMSRLERAADAFTQARDMLIGTFDVHMTRTAQRTNDVMRVLTLVSVVLLPAVVIAGVMGMNFKAPLFENPNLFYVVVGVMVALAAGTLLFARWRRWL